MSIRKPVEFLGDSQYQLRQFPKEARFQAGKQLDQVQRGKEPLDWKPMTSVGSGVREIRVRDRDGIYRVIYVAKFRDCVYVLHCFQKKRQGTSKADLDIARRRLSGLIKEIR